MVRTTYREVVSETEKVLQNYGLMVLFCGYDPSPNPIPEFTFKGRREISIPQDVSLQNLTEAEVDSHVASWTEWFAGWPVPLDAIPVVKSGIVDEPMGGVGILTSGDKSHRLLKEGTLHKELNGLVLVELSGSKGLAGIG